MKFLVILLIMFCGITFAHPPSGINLDFDLEKKVVSVELSHGVKSEDHYIYYVEVSLNGKVIIKQESSKQFDENVQKYMFLIPELKENDKISITGKCNKFGSLKREFIIKTQEAKK